MSKAVITKSRSKKKPFKVRILAGNNEVLSHHLLTTKLNVRKNLQALMKVFKGSESLEVEDRTTKKPSTFILYKDGFIRY